MRSRLASRIHEWSRHPHAERYLAAVSFAESSFFPIPPDLLLAPMCMSHPDKARRLALWTTLWSVLGGVAAFAVAMVATGFVVDALSSAGLRESLESAYSWFDTYGFAAVVVSGFSPIPYKVFAFGAGVMEMSLTGFVLASILGRGGRFFLVAELSRSGRLLASGGGGTLKVLGWSVAAAFGLYLVLA